MNFKKEAMRPQRRPVKASGGKQDPRRKVWQLPYEKVTELGLSDRIVETDQS